MQQKPIDKMKIAKLIIFFSCIALAVQAQQLKPNMLNKGKHTDFIVTQLNQSMAIVDKKNPYDDKKPKIAPTAINIFHKKDESAVDKAFREVFSDQRLKQLLPETAILVNYYVNTTGSVQYVSFLTRPDTKLTASELEQLQDALKKEVSFILDPDETRGGDFFVFSQAVKYRKLLYLVR